MARKLVDKICDVVSFYITRHGRGVQLCQVREDILIVEQPKLTRILSESPNTHDTQQQT